MAKSGWSCFEWCAIAGLSCRGDSRSRWGFIDHIEGKPTLIYIDQETSNPAAMFVDSRSAKMEGGEVHLDNGSIVRSGVLLDRSGKPRNAEHPQQMFTRWYGFALTFPGSEVFGQ